MSMHFTGEYPSTLSLGVKSSQIVQKESAESKKSKGSTFQSHPHTKALFQESTKPQVHPPQCPDSPAALRAPSMALCCAGPLGAVREELRPSCNRDWGGRGSNQITLGQPAESQGTGWFSSNQFIYYISGSRFQRSYGGCRLQTAYGCKLCSKHSRSGEIRGEAGHFP